MKRMKLILFCSIVFAIITGFWSCSEFRTPTEPTDPSLNDSIKKINKVIVPDEDDDDSDDVMRPETWVEEKIISYENGGKINIKSMVELHVSALSMSTGQDTRIFVGVILTEDDQLIFHFRPSGLFFDPQAELVLDPKKLEKKLGIEFDGDNPVYLKWLNPLTQEWEVVSSLGKSDETYKWDEEKRVTFKISHFSIWSFSAD